MRRRGSALLLAGALLSSACSSTLLQRDELAVTDGGPAATVPATVDDTTAAGAETPGSSSAGSTDGPPSGGGGQGPATTGGSGGPTTTSGSVSPAADDWEPGVPFLTQGISDTTIKVRVPTIKNGEAITALLGAAGLNLGNNRLETEALLTDLNERGGIAGRTVEAVYADVDYASSNIEASYLAACGRLADDHKVFAILMVLNPPPSFLACAASKGVIVLNGSVAPGDDDLIASAAPWYYAPSMASMSRVPGPMLDSVMARNFLAADSSVGVLAIDQPQYTRIAERSVIPALEARGVTVGAYERVATEAALQNAVLRFRQKGVTHVVFSQESGIPVLLFMRQAESQLYRPKYILSSHDAPGYLLEGNVADEQLRGILGIGWNPITDVDASRLPSTPLEERCFDIIRKGGEPVRHRQSHLTAEFMCDLVWAFEAVAQTAGPQLTTTSFRASFHGLGTGYQSVVVGPTDLSNRVDGVSTYRLLGYREGCRCVDYLAAAAPLP